MTIDDQRLPAKLGAWSSTYALVGSRYVRQLHDLRGHLRDPAHDHRPRRHRAGRAL